MIIRGVPKDKDNYYRVDKDEKIEIVKRTGIKPRYMDNHYYYFRINEILDKLYEYR